MDQLVQPNEEQKIVVIGDDTKAADATIEGATHSFRYPTCSVRVININCNITKIIYEVCKYYPIYCCRANTCGHFKYLRSLRNIHLYVKHTQCMLIFSQFVFNRIMNSIYYGKFKIIPAVNTF